MRKRARNGDRTDSKTLKTLPLRHLLLLLLLLLLLYYYYYYYYYYYLFIYLFICLFICLFIYFWCNTFTLARVLRTHVTEPRHPQTAPHRAYISANNATRT